MSTFWAYLTLFASGFLVAGIGLRYGAAVTLCLAAFLSTMVAMAIDFPYLFLLWIFYWLTSIRTIFKAATNGEQSASVFRRAPCIHSTSRLLATTFVRNAG